MEKKVTVLLPNARRQNVKVLPNTTLLQVLEEASLKHGFDSDEYCLLHHNKEIDLSVPFRFSGLPNNAVVEMQQMEKKRVTAEVSICIQLEDGTRSQGQFQSSSSLWQVIEKLCASAIAAYESPVAIYMRREVVGVQEMKSITLKAMGITEGRAMIRCINKNPEELKIQANVYVPATVKETAPKETDSANRSTRTTAAGAGGFAITKDLVQSLKKSSSSTEQSTTESADKMEESAEGKDGAEAQPEKPKYDWGTAAGRSLLRSEASLVAETERLERERLLAEMDVEPEYTVIGERNAILYSMDSTEKQIEELPDSFFDLTVHDLKLVLRDLKRIAAGNDDAPLLTEKLRELQEQKTMLNKIGHYKNCVIRIQFPDRHVLQGIFKPIDKVSDVVTFVRRFLLNKDLQFYLFTIPPKTVLSLDKTLLELDFVPTAVLHLSADQQDDDDDLSNSQAFLAAEYLSKLTTAEGALFAANKLRTVSNRKQSTEEAGNVENINVPNTSTGAIPKRRRNDAVN